MTNYKKYIDYKRILNNIINKLKGDKCLISFLLNIKETELDNLLIETDQEIILSILLGKESILEDITIFYQSLYHMNGVDFNKNKEWMNSYHKEFKDTPLNFIKNNSYELGFKKIVSNIHSRNLVL